VITNADKGELTTRALIDHMMVNTPLVVIEDQATGALMISRVASPGRRRRAHLPVPATRKTIP
jgi:hypothetical protein